MEAAAVGLVDVRIRSGAFPGYADPGFIPGGEVVGRVVETGPGVSGAWLGRRVWALVRTGGYAERCAVDEALLAPAPETISAVDAAALGANALVAEFCLRQGRVAPGERVLVRGGSGGIGVATIQAALLRGARVSAVTSNASWRQRIVALGAAEAFDRDDLGDLGGFDVIVDPVAGPESGAYADRLGPDGRYVLCGAAAGPPPADFGTALFRNSAKSIVIGFQSLNSVPQAALNAAAEEIFAECARGRLRPVIDDVRPLAQAAEVHARLEAGTVFGRLVLTP